MGLLNDPKGRKKMSEIILQHSQKLIVLSFFSGIIWFGLLASDSFNNKTYFSENALLPGLVVREFNPRSSLSQLVDSLKEEASTHPSSLPSAWILAKFRQLGLDVYQNNFTVKYPLGPKPVYKGNNLFAVLRAPKVASTEALVISTPYRDHNSLHDSTFSSIALMVELAKAFRTHSYWSKDVIFLITQYENIGFQAWLDAYHGVSTSDYIMSEKIMSYSGIIHGVINLEVASYRFSHIDVKIEGLHGQLPNLDLINLAVELCNREQITTTFQNRFNYYPSKPITLDNWTHNFITMSKMILLQATGLPTGGHGLFHRFGIQAITLKSVEDSRSGENTNLIQFGRVMEGTVRSLNNLLEKFHQSFFFYLLPSTRSYVSIGLYIPPFSLIALPVLIKALYLYVQLQTSLSSDNEDLTPSSSINYWVVADMFTMHLLFGLIILFSPLYLDHFREYFSLSTSDSLYCLQGALILCWFLCTHSYSKLRPLSNNEFSYKLCTTLLTLGGFMFTLALVNISFALILTLLYVPVSIVLQYRGRFSVFQYVYLLLINPFVFTYIIVVAQSFEMDSSVAWYVHFVRGVEGHKKLLLFTIEDMYFFGNWNYKIATLIVSPLWFTLWSLKAVNIKG